jgi:anthranilate phosphoribosyltransferase
MQSPTPPQQDTNNQLDALAQLLGGGLTLPEQQAHLSSLLIDPVDEAVLLAAVLAFRDRMTRVDLGPPDLVDLSGTGGDKSGTFNISTTASILAAAAGVPVAKHGNVAITSQSGSFDLLRAMGMWVPDSPEAARAQFDQHGITFLFGQTFHPALRDYAAARRALAALGKRTLFNILGPLLNPAGARRSLMGVFSPDLMEPIARVMLASGTESAWIVHGDGLDEFTLTGPTRITEIRDGKMKNIVHVPEDFGFQTCALDDLRGGTADENAVITRGILCGDILGPKRDIVILNAAAAIYVGREKTTMTEALALARMALKNGSAWQLCQRMAT